MQESQKSVILMYWLWYSKKKVMCTEFSCSSFGEELWPEKVKGKAGFLSKEDEIVRNVHVRHFPELTKKCTTYSFFVRTEEA